MVRLGFCVVSLGIALMSLFPCSAQTPGIRTIFCDGSHGCSHDFMNGEDFEVIKDGKLAVIAGVDGAIPSRKFLSITVMVINKTDSPLDILPSDFLLQTFDPKMRTLSPIPAEDVAEKVNHGLSYKFVMSIALRANTADPGKTVSGSLFFKPKGKSKAAVLHAIVGDTDYKFLLSLGNQD